MTENRMFTNEMLEKCYCTQAQLDKAICYGQKIETTSVDGRVTAYKFNKKLYIVNIDVSS